MADKKLNEVTKVTDMAYVPVILSDGSVGQIAKADLASVVAGLIGIGISETFSLSAGQEIETGVRGNGLVVITEIKSGSNVVISVSATTFDDSALLQSSGNSGSFSSSLTASGKIGVNRKTANGPIFIVNNKAIDTSVRVRAIPSSMSIGI